MTGIEKIAARNIKNAFNWIVGGYYNCLQDGELEYLPDSRQALANEIYRSALVDRYTPDSVQADRAPREMRFAGEAFCREYIEKLLNKDGDVEEIAAAANW